jgi:hypothetical protein
MAARDPRGVAAFRSVVVVHLGVVRVLPREQDGARRTAKRRVRDAGREANAAFVEQRPQARHRFRDVRVRVIEEDDHDVRTRRSGGFLRSVAGGRGARIAGREKREERRLR